MFQKGQQIGGLDRFVSKLDQAQQHLERAILELERAENARKPSAGSIDKANSAAAVEARISELESLNADINHRLNVAIDHLSKVLVS